MDGRCGILKFRTHLFHNVHKSIRILYASLYQCEIHFDFWRHRFRGEEIESVQQIVTPLQRLIEHLEDLGYVGIRLLAAPGLRTPNPELLPECFGESDAALKWIVPQIPVLPGVF